MSFTFKNHETFGGAAVDLSSRAQAMLAGGGSGAQHAFQNQNMSKVFLMAVQAVQPKEKDIP